jgi:hypothetical protein
VPHRRQGAVLRQRAVEGTEGCRVRIRICIKQLDPNTYQIEKQDLDPDRNQSEKQDLDQKGMDPQHCQRHEGVRGPWKG